jgi:hypothetical protein
MTMTMPPGSPNLDLHSQMDSELERSTLTPDQEAKIVSWTDNKYQNMKNARSMIERQWYMNLAFFYGKQNVVQQRIAGNNVRLVTPPAPPWRSRPVINKTRKIIRTELAKVTSQQPSASVVPASSEDKDMFAAQAGEQIWDSIYRTKQLRKTLRRTMWWTLICGTGYMKVYWDSAGYDELTGMPGTICYEQETPFHVFVPDLREPDIENQAYVIHVSTRTVDWVKMRYEKSLSGRNVDFAENVRQSNDILDDAFLNLVGTNHMENNCVMVYEVWIKPGRSPQFPHGAMFTVVNDAVVQYHDGYPYQHNQYPFVKFEHIESGKFYGTSVIEDIISLQKEYNRTRGQIIEAKNRMAKPQWLAAKGSIVTSRMSTEPGQVIEYKQGFNPPVQANLTPLPSYVLQELDRIQMDMDDISGQHEVSRGQVPPGVTAATAISYLQEQDDTVLSGTVQSIEYGMENVAKQTLSHVSQFWDVQRTVKVTGTDGSWDAVMFKGSDLHGNTDIRMEAGSALPTSKAAKQAWIMDMMKMNFIPPEEGLRIMEIGGVEKLYESIQIDQRQAQRENLKMQNAAPDLILQSLQPKPQLDEMGQPVMDQATGQPMPEMDPETGQPVQPVLVVPVNTWDNHAVHIEFHNRFRKSQAFDNLPEENKVLFEQHVQAHMAAIAAPHMGGMPTPEMMIGMAEQQAQMPPPSDMNTPMNPDGSNPEGGPAASGEELVPGPEAMPQDSQQEMPM